MPLDGQRQKQFGDRLQHWQHTLRPLAWWVILVLVLYGYRLHQRLLEQTVVKFSAALQGRPVDYEAIAFLDGRRIASGTKVPIGWHTFSVSHSKAEPCTTNLFIWYGEHDLGRIALKRQLGTLTIEAEPPAALLTIRGPEFALTLTNSAGVTRSVPTDRYAIVAKYRYSTEQQEMSVIGNSVAHWRLAPRIGALHMTCNQADAAFDLRDSNGQTIEMGPLPSMAKDLPAASYKLVAFHHDYRRDQDVTVRAGMTNTVAVEFLYGAAVLESDPAGATVRTKDGHSWGVTPLHLGELQPGHWTFVLEQDGYEPASLALDIVANQTNAFRASLVNSSYLRAVRAAREYLNARNYDRAYDSSVEALRIKLDDPDATSIRQEATKQRILLSAKAFAGRGDYAKGITELETALRDLPDDVDLKQLLSDFKKRQGDQVERLRQERLERPKTVFDSLLRRIPDSDLFESHEVKVGKSIREVHLSVANALRNEQPAFVVMQHETQEPDTFAMEAKQQWQGGARICLIAGGQTGDYESQILFKVLEYKTEAANKFSIGALLNTPVEVNYIPIHPSRIPQMTDTLQAQVRDGIRMVGIAQANGGWPQVTLTYDYLGRRVSKQVLYRLQPVWGWPKTWFVYDGWNLAQEITSIPGTSAFNFQSYVWGLDLSGTEQGAGGIGGLLAVNAGTKGTLNADTNVIHFVVFDGNGNVVALMNADSGALSAEYEYGPFGELLRATGPMAKGNPLRFSTKYQDDETGLLYYGFRYYQPSTGRWLSRDPIGEKGNRTLYVCAGNTLLSDWDFLGLDDYTLPTAECTSQIVGQKRASSLIEFQVRSHGVVLWKVPFNWLQLGAPGSLPSTKRGVGDPTLPGKVLVPLSDVLDNLGKLVDLGASGGLTAEALSEWVGMAGYAMYTAMGIDLTKAGVENIVDQLRHKNEGLDLYLMHECSTCTCSRPIFGLIGPRFYDWSPDKGRCSYFCSTQSSISGFYDRTTLLTVTPYKECADQFIEDAGALLTKKNPTQAVCQ